MLRVTVAVLSLIMLSTSVFAQTFNVSGSVKYKNPSGASILSIGFYAQDLGLVQYLGATHYKNGPKKILDSSETDGLVQPWQAQKGDIDGDGDLDLIVRGWLPTIKVFRNNGTGSFTYWNEFLLTDKCPKLPQMTMQLGDITSLADMDQDGDLDLVFSEDCYTQKAGKYTEYPTLINVGWNNGSGVFKESNSYVQIGKNFMHLQVHDIDNDGLNDVLGIREDNSEIIILYNKGKSSKGKIQFNGCLNKNGELVCPKLATSKPWKYVVQDFNGDGQLDIATLVKGNINKVAVYFGDAGTFFETANWVKTKGDIEVTVAADASDLLVGDFNNDYWPDLALAGDFGHLDIFPNLNGKFAYSNSMAIPLKSMSMFVYDINYDGFDDIFFQSGNKFLSLINAAKKYEVKWNALDEVDLQTTIGVVIAGNFAAQFGEGMKGAKVTVGTKQAISDAAGHYTVKGLKPGFYSVSGMKAGFLLAPDEVSGNAVVGDQNVTNYNLQGKLNIKKVKAPTKNLPATK